MTSGVTGRPPVEPSNRLHAPFAEGLWLATEPIRIVGMPLTATMCVLRLSDDGLLVYSPISLTPRLRADVEALGPVSHLYAPNLFHHLRIGEWAAAFPSARLHAPPGLARKRPDLRIDRVHGATPEPAFDGVVDEVRIEGFRLEESVVLYRPARTLVVADLVHNVGRPEPLWPIVYTRAMGFYDRVAMSRMIRWTAFSDTTKARASIDAVLALPFDGLVVGHGAPVRTGGQEAITDAFRWLTARGR